ncbi:MAG: bifunctional glutamate N-acetyltransferase/amino-acid acetyltransferase ArgJ [Spirochaetota bacterium]|nr:bifunctional glutamate N-acetyltransferase/amino-acid acetyltransferase ArgJ [Spirochaetota bacterium]
MIQHQLPRGFMAGAFSGGIKKEGSDIAVLYSTHGAVSAGVFTSNRVRAACIDWNSERIGRSVRAVIVNSGNANACTGYRGIQDSEKIAAAAAEKYGVERDEVLLASTGVIGVPLPVDSMCSAISASPPLHDSPTALHEAARAIMTTDTVEKVSSYEFHVEGRTVRILGMAKGSGMIHPNMATMLGFILTDVAVDAPILQHLLHNAAEESFNMISVDGDTSTNDMVLALANGTSGVEIKTPDSHAWKEFKQGLRTVSRDLAVAIARDGEGATKLIEARVEGASSVENARKLARSVISSNLVKSAMFGEDANWGRVLAAMGYSGGTFNPHHVDIIFSSTGGEVLLMEKGIPVDFDETAARTVLKEEEIVITIKLTEGSDSAAAWGCDLTYDYVKINGSYRT